MVKYFSGMMLPGISVFTIIGKKPNKLKPYDYIIKQIPLSIHLVKYSLTTK
jgi:hypothetical protein